MTNNPRIYLWIALALMAWLNWDAYQRDYAPATAAITNTTHPANPNPPPNAANSASDLANQIPQAGKETSPAATASTTPSAAAANSTDTAAPTAPVVHVHTDVLDVDISTVGGTIQRVDLLKYPKVKGETAPVRLENQDDPLTTYLLQSGLTGSEPTPSHLTPL